MNGNEEKLWLNFLSWWTFFLPLPIILWFISIGILVSSAGDAPIELGFLVVEPYGHRIMGLTNNLLWGSVIIFFIALSRLYRTEYPIKSTLLAAFGVGHFIPMSTGNMQYLVGLDLANRYSNATAEQKEIIELFQMSVFQIIDSRMDLANLLWGIGILLFIFMARKTIPKLTQICYFLSAVIFLTIFLSNIIGFYVTFAVVPIYFLLVIIGHISLGFVFLKRKKSDDLFNSTLPEKAVI